MLRKRKARAKAKPPSVEADEAHDDLILDPAWVGFDPLPFSYLTPFPTKASAPGQFISAAIADKDWASAVDPKVRLAIATAIGAQCTPWHGFTEQLHEHLSEFHTRAHPVVLQRLALAEENCRDLDGKVVLLEARLAAVESRGLVLAGARTCSLAISET